MQNILFFPTDSIETVLYHLENDGAKVIAGGTDIIPKLRRNHSPANAFVDLSHVNELRYIRKNDNTIHLGAAVTFTDLIHDEQLHAVFPSLIHAAKTIGCPQTRARATIAGNLANASPAADSAPPLLILNAMVVIRNIQSTRMIPISELFVSPGKIAINQNELITEIQIQVPPDHSGQSFLKIGKRKGMAISIANCAAFLLLEPTGLIKDVRIALGSVAPIPKRIQGVEEFLIHKQWSEQLIKEATEILQTEIAPISDIRASQTYRIKTAQVITKRCLLECYDQLQRNRI